MNVNIDKHLIHHSKNIKEAMFLLNQLAMDAILFVIDEHENLKGSLTDGDIRRSYFEKVSWDASVDSIMSMNPIGVPVGLSNQKFIEEVFRQAEHASHLSARYVRYVLVLDRDQRVVDVKDFFHLLWHEDQIKTIYDFTC